MWILYDFRSTHVYATLCRYFYVEFHVCGPLTWQNAEKFEYFCKPLYNDPKTVFNILIFSFKTQIPIGLKS